VQRRGSQERSAGKVADPTSGTLSFGGEGKAATGAKQFSRGVCAPARAGAQASLAVDGFRSGSGLVQAAKRR